MSSSKARKKAINSHSNSWCSATSGAPLRSPSGLLRDEQDAREVVQEAFLRVHRGLDSFHGGSTFFTWLYRIVTNLSIDLMRKPARREAELDESREIDEADIPLLSRIDGADPLDVLRRAEIRNKLEAALAAASGLPSRVSS